MKKVILCIYHFSINFPNVIICNVNLMSLILNAFVKFTNIESSQSQQPVLSEYRSITNEFREEDVLEVEVS